MGSLSVTAFAFSPWLLVLLVALVVLVTIFVVFCAFVS